MHAPARRSPRFLGVRARLAAGMTLFAALGVAAVAHGHETGKHRVHEPSPDELSALEAAKPVFEQYCARCHARGAGQGKRKALAHFDMTRYPFRGHHAHEAGTAVREVLGAAGDKATMPSDRPGAVKGQDLEKMLAWAAAFDRARGESP
jgi:cytochrome c